jgi:hypothetical protein
VSKRLRRAEQTLLCVCWRRDGRTSYGVSTSPTAGACASLRSPDAHSSLDHSPSHAGNGLGHDSGLRTGLDWTRQPVKASSPNR